MDIKIHNPHDSFVKRGLVDLEVARDILKSHISPALAAQFKWDTLQLTNRSFVKEELKQFHSDVVYKCDLNGKNAYIYTFVEHQSTPDRMLPFRILQYNVALMEEHLAQENELLPIIINVCLYAGAETPYPHSVDIYDCFEDRELARQEVFKPLNLIDLTIISQEELLRHGKADLLEILLKQGVLREFISWVKANKELVTRLLSRFYGESGVIYMLGVDAKNDPKKLIEAIIEAVPDKKHIVMTAAQQLIQQGMQQEKLIIAKNMLLKLHLDIDTVQKATDITKEELEGILKQSESNR